MSGQVLSAEYITEVPVIRCFILSAFFSHLGVSFHILSGICFLNLFQLKSNWENTRVNPIFLQVKDLLNPHFCLCKHIKSQICLSDWAHTQNIISVAQFGSVTDSVMSDSLWPNEPQHARPPRPSPTPGVYSNSCPLSRWWHQTISSSVVSFSSYLQSFPASGSFQMSQFFAPGGQSIGVSASASVLPMNTQDWSPLGWIGWISLQSKGLSRIFSNTTVQKH